MKRLIIAAITGLLFYSDLAFGGVLWSTQPIRRLSWGSVDVVTTAQYYCDHLKERGLEHWRLPTESELLNSGPKNLPGIFWSANGVPFRVRGQTLIIAVDLEHTKHLFVELNSKQQDICVHDQF